MVRVVRIADASTIVVERDRVQSLVQLAGIEITDRDNAIAFLTWTIGSSWVMIDNGQVYRSPDALLINAELVKKGYARFTSPVAPGDHTPIVYLGELDLGPRPAARAASTPTRRARVARPSPVRRRVVRPRITRALLR